MWKTVLKWTMRIICLLLPLIGFFIALGLKLFRKDDRAEEALFFSFVGIFISIVVLLPLWLFFRFTLFAVFGG